MTFVNIHRLRRRQQHKVVNFEQFQDGFLAFVDKRETHNCHNYSRDVVKTKKNNISTPRDEDYDSAMMRWGSASLLLFPCCPTPHQRGRTKRKFNFPFSLRRVSRPSFTKPKLQFASRLCLTTWTAMRTFISLPRMSEIGFPYSSTRKGKSIIIRNNAECAIKSIHRIYVECNYIVWVNQSSMWWWWDGHHINQFCMRKEENKDFHFLHLYLIIAAHSDR